MLGIGMFFSFKKHYSHEALSEREGIETMDADVRDSEKLKTSL
jgi:hypothetical protein